MSKKRRMRESAVCSFCRKSYREVGPLVEGPGDVYICGECAELCQSIIAQEKRRRNRPGRPFVPSLTEAREKLGQFFPEQQEARETLLAAIHSHYERLTQIEQQQGSPAPDQWGILLLGPSQSSKLYLTRVLAHIFDVPFAHGDPRRAIGGPAGQEFNALLYTLLVAGDFDIEAVQHGMVYVEGVHEREVQEVLLEMIQGRLMQNPLPPLQIQMDFTNILFFSGSESPGLANVTTWQGRNLKQPAMSEDLIATGVIPELARCFNTIVTLGLLEEDTLVRIIDRVDLKGGVNKTS